MRKTMKKTCSFTGHRKIPPVLQESITRRLEETIINCVKNGYSIFMAGGALGFDTLAAEAVLRIRKNDQSIKLILALPCRTQTRNWDQSDIDRYEEIRKDADDVIYISDAYTKDCMFRRNRYLIDHSDLCICYLTENRGGTFYTVRYAEKKGKTIHNLAKT